MPDVALYLGVNLFNRLMFYEVAGESIQISPFILGNIDVPQRDGMVTRKKVPFWLQRSSSDKPTSDEVETVIIQDPKQHLSSYYQLPILELCRGITTFQTVTGREPKDTRVVSITIEEIFRNGKSSKSGIVSKAFKDKTPTLKGCFWTMIPEDVK